MKKIKEKFNLLHAISLIGLIPLLSAITILTMQSGFLMRQEFEDATYDKLTTCATSVEQYFYYDIVEKILSKDNLSYNFIDSLKDNDVELTLFQGDTRYITSIKDTRGNRVEDTKASEEIWNTVKAGETYYAANVDISNKEYYVCYLPVYDENGDIWGMAFAGTPEEVVDTAKEGIVNKLYIVSIILLVLFAVILLFIAKTFRKPLRKAADSVQKIADGDLTEDIETNALLVETRDLLVASKTLQDQLSNVVSKVKNTSDDMAKAVDDLDNLATSSTDGAAQINTAVEELAVTAQSLAENVQDVNVKAIEMGEDIDGISSEVNVLKDQSKEMLNANTEAVGSMGAVLDSSDKSSKAVEEIAAHISSTNDAITQIHKAVELILDIADQTKLLSLNASIEAAHAGESGKGFAVVAQEIKNLSEQSAQGAKAIEDIANDILAKSGVTVQLSKDIRGLISKEQEDIAKVQQSFETLSDNVMQSMTIADNIFDRVGHLNSSKEGILNNITDLSAISEENAASNEEVTASVANIANSISNISKDTETLNDMAVELGELIQYFKTFCI